MKVGILGTGEMAGEMAEALTKMKHFMPYAVASKTTEKAKAFTASHNIEKYYESYEAMLLDENVELVYIATPHALHYKHCLMCVAYEKPVICEKSFMLNAGQAEEVFRKAEENHVFITEAIWTRYLPFTPVIRDMVRNGRIGRVKAIRAVLSYPVSGHDRVTNPSLGGGVLLDLGIYVLTFISMVLGDDVRELSALAELYKERIDLSGSVIMRMHPSFSSGIADSGFSDDQAGISATYTLEDMVLCSCDFSVVTASDRYKIIYGTEGYLITGLKDGNDRFLEIYDRSHRCVEKIERLENSETDFVYEFEACRHAIENNLLECKEIPHVETVTMMKLMDRIRKEMGVKYPSE